MPTTTTITPIDLSIHTTYDDSTQRGRDRKKKKEWMETSLMGGWMKEGGKGESRLCYLSTPFLAVFRFFSLFSFFSILAELLLLRLHLFSLFLFLSFSMIDGGLLCFLASDLKYLTKQKKKNKMC